MEQYRFFGSATGDTREYTQTEFAEVLATIFSNGFRHNIGNELETIASTPNVMTVETQSGEAWVNGYWYKNSENKVLTISTADATNPRIDSVILRLDTLTARSVIVTILQGTPAVTPVAPTLTQTSQIWEIRLADIAVGVGVTLINDSNITNYKDSVAFIGSNIMSYDEVRQVLQYSNLDGTNNDVGGELWYVDGIAIENIPNGSPVQFAGASGDNYLIKIAVPSEINADPSLFMGLATRNILINTIGKVTKFGLVHDMNTSTFSIGDKLFFNSTSGGLTSTKPTSPNAIIQVCAVVVSDTTNGIVLVRVTEMDKYTQAQVNTLLSAKAPLASPTFTGDVYGVQKSFNATLPYTSWTGSVAPFTKVVSVAGILSTDYPNFDVATSGTYATDILRKDEWAKVYAWVTSTDSITFYATSVPTVDLPLMVKVVR